MNETYERILVKIIDQGKSEIAGNVFRWVAAVKRPLNLDEIREAMAIKPCQQYMKSELLLNDISKITSWCRNLIVLDEEDQSIRFAHHSTMQFFLHSLSNPRLQAFHINVTDFDHHVGSICVTYLNFSDFERQLSKGATRKVEVESNDIVKAALLSNPDSAFARSIFKLDKFWWSKSAQKFDMSSLSSYAKPDPAGWNRKVQTQYAFLAYAREYWLAHSSEFNLETATWKLWKNLVESENSMAERPWAMTEWRSQSRSISQWIVENNHYALLSLWLSALTISEQKYLADSILPESSLEKSVFYHSRRNACFNHKGIIFFALGVAARRKDLETVTDLASSYFFQYKAWELECEALLKAAAIGHSQIIETLLHYKANKESVDADGNTAAHHAAAGGHDEALQVLHKHDAWLQAQNSDGLTPVDLARRFCDERTLTAIIPRKYPGWGEWCGYLDEERGPLPQQDKINNDRFSRNMDEVFDC